MSNKNVKILLVLGMIFLYLWLGFLTYNCEMLRNSNGDFINKLVSLNKASQEQLKECQIQLEECLNNE